MALLKKNSLHRLQAQLAALYYHLLKYHDTANAEKVLDLYDKQQHQTVSIGFAGHFSAGKSSMINTLLGKEILPKSPIPTSANIVRLSSGQGAVRVYFKHQQPVEYSEPYDIEQIKAYSQDKSSIKQIDISISEPLIPENRYIIDTPGIDAADDADRVITKSAMHVVDHVFYIMDYNHVQSGANLDFLENLQEQSTPFSIIINQIDKHDPYELTFTNFKNTVETTFIQWGLSPDHIYYTSLVDTGNNYNDLAKVRKTLLQMLRIDYEHIQQIESAVQHIVDDHKRFLSDQAAEQTYLIEQQQSSIKNQADLGEVNDEISLLDQQPDNVEHNLLAAINHTLKNAYLMPAVTRDQAEAFLQSVQSDFKVGIIGSKRKTQKERAERSQALLNSLNTNMQTAIQWKLVDKLTQVLKQFDLNEDALLQPIQTIKVTFTDKDLLKLVKTGAKVNGQYVLNFTEATSQSIKQRYKQTALDIINTIKSAIKSQNKTSLQYLRQKKKTMEKDQAINLEKQTLHQNLELAYQAVDSAIQTISVAQNLVAQIEDELSQRQISFVKQAGETMAQTVRPDANEAVNTSDQAAEESHKEQSVSHIVPHLIQTIKTVKQIPGFSTFIADLKQKQQRFENRRYTVALFGAFSAGKSSFANALLGEAILPVTPNPTTAAVNRINPVTHKYTHKTVIVQMKDEPVLIQDLLTITKGLSPQGKNFPALLKWIKTYNIQNNGHLSQAHQAYLQAMLNGYHFIKDAIGQSLAVSLEDFPNYVADETKACFIESIDLYYDCPLTRKGITLVDTPGTDSVNARHTSVAFDYIKQADAILYVTYYNHALSEADQTFLMQLGRVKDAFELDKMFFIVNAVDLAENAADLKLVMSHINDQLTQLGIRLPRLYPISSKLALSHKQQNQTLSDEMTLFEGDFHRFIQFDLTALTTKSALWDINRTHRALVNYKETLSMDQTEQETFRHTLESDLTKAHEAIATLDTEIQTSQLIQKIDKQVYYVWERVSLRYHDMFKASFNPTTITNSRHQAQAELNISLKSLIDDIGYELLQELRAVSLRVEQTEQKLVQDVYKQITDLCEQINNRFTFSALDTPDLITPDYKAPFQLIDLKQFNPALALFKNTKSFFADNQKEIMKEKIYDLLAPLATEYLKNEQTIMMEHYKAEWAGIIQVMKKSLHTQLDQQVSNQLDMMTSPVDLKAINQKIIDLERTLAQYQLT